MLDITDLRVTREIEGRREEFSMRADHQEKSMIEVIDQLPVIIEVHDEDYRSVHLPCEPFED